MKTASLMMALVAVTASAAVPFKNGTRFALKDVPGELVVERLAEVVDSKGWSLLRLRVYLKDEGLDVDDFVNIPLTMEE